MQDVAKQHGPSRDHDGMEMQRLSMDEALRLRHIRLRALADAPDAFGSTYADVSAHPLDMWRQQLQESVTFVAVRDGEDVGIVRCASVEHQHDTCVAQKYHPSLRDSVVLHLLAGSAA